MNEINHVTPDTGKISATLADLLTDPAYSKAKNDDFAKLSEAVYLETLDKIRPLLDERNFMSPDVQTAIRKVRGQLVSMGKSSLRTWALQALTSLEQTVFPKVPPKASINGENVRVNKQIIEVMQTGREAEAVLNEIVEIFRKNYHILDSVNIGTILYNLSKITDKRRGKFFQTKNLDCLLVLCAKKLSELSAENLSARTISGMLYGLKNLNQVPESLFLGLSDKIKTSKEELNGQAMGNALYGLQSSSNIPEQLFLALTEKIRQSKAELNGQAMGNALYGLQSSSNIPEQLFLALTAKIAQSKAELDSQNIGNALYGLKSSTNVPEELFLALTEKIRQSKAELDGQTIGNALYGLQCSSDVPEQLWLALTEKITQSKAEINGQEMGNALYGLQSSTNVPEELFLALTEKIRQSKAELDAQNIGNVLYGLQSSTNVPEQLFLALTAKIAQSKAELNSQQIGNALYGLQNLTTVSEELLAVLAGKIKRSNLDLSQQGMINALEGIFNVEQSPSAQEIRDILLRQLEKNFKDRLDFLHARYLLQIFSLHQKLIPDWLTRLYEKYVETYQPQPNSTEKKAWQYLQKKYPNEKIEVNSLLDSGFEMDIFFPERKINLELDYVPYHRNPLRERKRDQCLLATKGIRVIRLSLKKGYQIEDEIKKLIEANLI